MGFFHHVVVSSWRRGEGGGGFFHHAIVSSWRRGEGEWGGGVLPPCNCFILEEGDWGGGGGSQLMAGLDAKRDNSCIDAAR